MAHKRINFGLDFRQCNDGGFNVDIRNLPVADPALPSRELLHYHGAVLRLAECGHKGGPGEIGFLQLQRFGPGSADRHSDVIESPHC